MQSPLPAAAKHVLIVEDDEPTLRLMTRAVSAAGHRVTSFGDFEGAKKYLEATEPDVLVTDVRLGAFNGLQLVVIGRLEHPRMNAVVLTGFDDAVLREQASNAGASYLVKPVQLRRLVAAINEPTRPDARPTAHETT